MKKFNILVFTGGRSDFDLLLPVIKKLEVSKFINLSLLVSGSHLSIKHGLTINYIKKKNIKNIKKIDIKCDNVNEKNIPIIFGNAQNKYGKYLLNLKKKN
jgi:UDP-N-acetylglucosamine 2-epimerase